MSNRKWFIEDAERCTKLTKTNIRLLLDTITAPADLQALFLVLKNLPAIFTLAEKNCLFLEEDDLIESTLKPCRQICKTLLEKEEEFKANHLLSHLFHQEGKTTSEHFDDKKESHPLYCCLGHGIDDDSLNNRYNHLLAQVFLASRSIQKTDPKGLLKLFEAFRGVRFLSQEDNSAQLISIPSDPLPPAEFFKLITRITNAPRLQAASNILKKARFGFGKKRRKQNTSPTNPNLEKDPDQPEVNDSGVLWTGVESSQKLVLSDTEAEEYKSHGGAGGELVSPKDSIPVPAHNERIYSGPTLRELAFQAKQRSNQLAISNQLSPWSWNELNQYDVSIFLKYLGGELSSGALDSKKERQARLLLCIIFWTSSSLERAWNLPLFLSGEPKSTSAEGLYWQEGEKPLLRLSSPGATLHARNQKKKFRQAHQVIRFSHVPLANLACESFRPWINQSHQASSVKQLFNLADQNDADPIDAQRTNISTVLKRLNSKFGCRLSVGRTSHYLLNSLARYPGEDLPSAMLFFGLNDKTAVTRMHYTVAPLLRLEKSYRKFCSQQLSKLGTTVSFPAPFPTNKPGDNLGTPFCPTPATIQKLVQRLQDSIDLSRRNKKSFSSVAHLHNHFAIYTTLFIAFATGYRAIQDPSFKEEEIDQGTGLAMISDKDNDDYYNCRKVWIADACLEQISNYRSHLVALFDFLGPTSPPIYNLIKDHSSSGRPLKLFFLTQNLEKAEVLRPGLLGDILFSHYDYDLPINANRHYLKTELLASGCSPEILEAFLGHWELGQEPWNGLSNLSPQVFRTQIKKHLRPLLKRDGWRAIKGLAG